MNRNRDPFPESQRDSALQPRIATQELPWVMAHTLATTPTGLQPNMRGWVPVPQPRGGWEELCDRLPRVVPLAGQPWAGGRNPVGIEARLRSRHVMSDIENE